MDVFFYHLWHQPLEHVLPCLLEKALARRWRAVVQVGSEERLKAIDQVLWTYADDSFLPHGTACIGHSGDQPVYLTSTDETPNGAGVRFFVDGAETREFAGADRFVYVFDSRDPDAVASVRSQWRAAKAAACVVTYWQQSKGMRWEQRT